jgi:predicted DsbA family dithiol-disulfide isomerase
MKKLRVDVWSDVVCPWCAIGKRRLEKALSSFPHKDEVEVVWRSFELDPSAPAVQPGDNATRLARKYGMSREQAAVRIKQVSETAARDGLAFDLAEARSGNTFDAHRVLHLAAERGIQGAVKERFFRGYMGEREAIGEHDVLLRLASEAGLDAGEVRETLAGDRFGADVREEEDAARQLGITGVPFFVFGGALGVPGAQPPEILLRALEEAWDKAPEKEETEETPGAEGAACGPEGCG